MKKLILCILISMLFSRELRVEFHSENDWLYARSWAGGTTFYNGVSYGAGLAGDSNLETDDVSNVDIHFSNNPDSMSTATIYSTIADMELDSIGCYEDVLGFLDVEWYTIADNSLDDASGICSSAPNNYCDFCDTLVYDVTFPQLGLGQFPGIAQDVSDPDNPRRLNLIFFEESDGNQLWDPVDVIDGNYEYLQVMASDYDPTGMTYNGLEGYEQDVMYFGWFRKRPGQEWMSSLPAVLEFRNFWNLNYFVMGSGDQMVEMYWEHENTEAEMQELSHYNIMRRTSTDGVLEIVAEVPAGTQQYIDTGLENGVRYDYYLEGVSPSGDILLTSETLSAIPEISVMNTALTGHWMDGNDNPYLPYGVSTFNDIWGYTSEDGTEYALVGGYDGTYIVDVSSNLPDPFLVSFVPGSYSTHRDIKTNGHFMYTGTEANLPHLDSLLNDVYYIQPQGVQVVDIENPAEPVVVNEWDGVVQSHNLMEADGYLYVIGSSDLNSVDGTQESWGLHNLIILDLENPADPQMIGHWDGQYLHDVCVKDDLLFGCAIYSNSMIVFDISDKTNPVEITSWGGVPSAHSCWVSEDGNTIFTGSETTGGHIMSFDITDINNIGYLDEWTPPGGSSYSAHNVFVKGDFLYISYYVYGLQILDISDPANMERVGVYDTYPLSGSYIYSGAWGTYPYLPSGNIITSDRTFGLYVTDFQEENLNMEATAVTPADFELLSVYPNPLNPETQVRFYLNSSGSVRLNVFNIQGRIVQSSELGVLSQGNHTVKFDGSNLASGIYFLRLSKLTNQNASMSNGLPITILK